MKQIPVACQLYSLRSEWPVQPLETLRFLQKTGYTGVELYGNFFSPEFHAALLKESGLVCAGWHMMIDELEGERFDATVKKNLAVGNNIVCVPYFQADSVDGWKRFCDRLNAAAERLARYGMKTGYHNHAHEFKPVEGVMPWAVIAENTAPEVILQLDIGNCMSAGADALEWLRKYEGGRNMTIHCKPWCKKSGFSLSQGDDAPWSGIIDWCRTRGRTDWLIVEYEEEDAPRDGVKQMFEKLR